MYKDRSDVVVRASATTISKWLDMKEELSKRKDKISERSYSASKCEKERKSSYE